jgi:hypothetical protein
MTLLIITILVSGCISDEDDGVINTGKLRTDDTFVDIGDAKAVEVNLEIGRGLLSVRPGLDKLMEGTFKYNIAKWKPEFSYIVENATDDVWNLTIRQPNNDLKVEQGARNEWDIHLLYYVPMSLDVKMGSGTSEIRVGGMDLASLSVAAGSGDVNVDLSGDWFATLVARIGTGAGNVDLIVPSAYGVQISVIQGSGKVVAPGFTKVEDNYKNAAFDTAGILLLIAVDIGAGDVVVLEVP